MFFAICIGFWLASYLKALNNLAPSCLSDLLQISSVFLIQPRINLNRMGSSAFSYAAPYLWNALPQYISKSDNFHTFKYCLKTHLFMHICGSMLTDVLIYFTGYCFIWFFGLLVRWPWVPWKAPINKMNYYYYLFWIWKVIIWQM